MEMRACNALDLQLISGAIHDAWFDTADIRWDRDRQELEIRIKRENPDGCRTIKRFLFAKKISTPVVWSTLRIAHASTYEIRDAEGIGSYDIGEIRYHDDSVVISSNIPLSITIKVNELEVSLVDSDEVIEEKTEWTIFA